MLIQVLQDIKGTLDVEEEFNDICEACEVANKVRHHSLLLLLLLLLLHFMLSHLHNEVHHRLDPWNSPGNNDPAMSK